MYFWMKKLFFLTLILFCLGCNEKKITFPHGYVWEKTLPNQSELIDPAGNIILSGYLSLWSQYPFVYGNGNKNNEEFVLNLKTGEIIFFESSQDFNSFLKKNKFPEFYTPGSDKHQTTINNIFYLKDTKSKIFMENLKEGFEDN